MRRAYLLAVPLLLWGAAAWAADIWTYFADPAGIFTVAVPATPIEGHDSTNGSDGKPISMTTYIIERGKGALALLVSDLTRFADTSHMLDEGASNLKSGAASGYSDAPITVDGNAGHDVHFTDQRGLTMEDRMFIIDKHMYQVMTVLAPDADATSAAAARRFIGSVHFLKH